MPQSPWQQSPFATLRRFVRPRALRERCDLCSAALAANHQHLLKSTSRQLLCACEACAILFSSQSSTPYRRIPQRRRYLPDFRLSAAQWESLRIPIGLAFFLCSTSTGQAMVIYPSPAGPIESLLDREPWEELVHGNPVLREMEPDVEALLVNRVGHGHAYYLVPLDVCYQLVGVIRTSWRGLSGGAEMWQAIGQFFAELSPPSRACNETSRA